MVRNILKQIRRLLTIPVEDIELVRAQFRAFAKQIPLLYFILATNTVALISTYAKFGHSWITVYAPSALCVICVVRGIKWWRIGRSEVPDAMIIGYMRTTNRLAFLIAVAFTAWGMMLFSFGDAYAKGQVVFFLALTMISCIFCLMHLRPAALTVCFVGVVPFSLFFFFGDNGHFRAAAVNLALVAVGMIAILLIYYRDFSNLVASRRELIDKQAETQRLSDDNFRLANHDSLSGLPNRRALVARLNEIQADHRQGVAPTAVVFIDLDGFKDVNDTYGHETGDKLIQIVADKLRQRTPMHAMLARLGGDEFAVLISADGAQDLALTFADAVVEMLKDPILIGARTIKVGASVGIAFAVPGQCDAQELFRQADSAMYHVKANGKAGARVYSFDLDAERHRRQECEEDIRRGLTAQEFEVFYQPIVDAASKSIVAVEALLRWPRRAGSEIGPDQFIKVAEASGLINPLGLFVLRRACRDLKQIDSIKLCVNISPAQFRDPGFETKVAEILAQSAFPAERLELELTEGYLIDHPQRAAAAISSLKRMGVAIALDDFGTGYSSIAYLQQYGFNRIKIDKSLAGLIATDKRAAVLITGAVYLANGLEMDVTAEGVETEEQERLLRLAGCQYLQGFRYCKPKSFDDLKANELFDFRLSPQRLLRARA
jgi:diguanylate cyclase (GGDEF)-like protein